MKRTIELNGAECFDSHLEREYSLMLTCVRNTEFLGFCFAPSLVIHSVSEMLMLRGVLNCVCVCVCSEELRWIGSKLFVAFKYIQMREFIITSPAQSRPDCFSNYQFSASLDFFVILTTISHHVSSVSFGTTIDTELEVLSLDM